MKRLFVAVLLGAGLVAGGAAVGFVSDGTSVNAVPYGKGGFTGPGAATANTVAAAKRAWDDTWVVLRGHITRQIAHEKYIFADSTGEIVVDIDDKYIRYITVTPNDLVEISGEVDNEFFERTEIDVKRISIVR